MFSGLRMWVGAIVSVAFGGLVLWAKMLKAQRDTARRSRDILEAGRRSSRVKENIIKEEEEQTDSRTAELVRDIIKEKESDKEFQGVDILSNPNARVRNDK